MIHNCEAQDCGKIATVECKVMGFVFKFCNKHSIRASYAGLQYDRKWSRLREEFLDCALAPDKEEIE